MGVAGALWPFPAVPVFLCDSSLTPGLLPLHLAVLFRLVVPRSTSVLWASQVPLGIGVRKKVKTITIDFAPLSLGSDSLPANFEPSSFSPILFFHAFSFPPTFGFLPHGILLFHMIN